MGVLINSVSTLAFPGIDGGNYRDWKFISIVYLKRLVYSLSPSDSVSFSSLANNSSAISSGR